MFKAGIDVGSTTVKGVLLDEENRIVFSSYERHEARQLEKVLKLLKKFEEIAGRNFHLFLTGSGGGDIASFLKVRFVQEVNATALAVEEFFEDVSSVVELGGQDAKMIFWIKGKKISTMNDKCAGGTGATLDRIVRKLGIPEDKARQVGFDPSRIHPVAAKCGVFAETDVNSLQKAGIPVDEILMSLFNAIVIQNLAVLTRGYTLRPKVLLLGGPNTYFKGLVECWKHHLKRIWEEKGIPYDENSVVLPENSHLFAAIGSALMSKFEESPYRGTSALEEVSKKIFYIKKLSGERGLLKPGEDLEEFKKRFTPKPPVKEYSDTTVDAFLGIDGGSTSTKMVLIDTEANVIETAYTLSSGNPLEDVKKLARELLEKLKKKNLKVNVLSVGVTGYAKEMLKETISADVSIVETVAHTIAGRHFFKNIDVIVDVGGQDIKVIMLKNNEVKDFRLNTQCSAGNGYFLQSTAEKFGYRIEEFADVAFKAEYAPKFNFGCAVFLEQDIVNFQRLGWQPHEIMAGLAKVLPKNVWLYVVKEPNLRRLGKVFLLQGGTQKNLAVVKAQYDFIKERVEDAEIYVHPITGEAGAFGSAVEAMRRYDGKTNFPGLETIANLEFEVKSDASTRCSFCPNRCLRTFVYARTSGKKKLYIMAPCERGRAVSSEEAVKLSKKIAEIKKKYPNLQEIASREVFSLKPLKKYPSKRETRIGIPRVLNFYALTPFFVGYFGYLGVKNIVFSDFTTEKLVMEEMIGGAIDPCFPSKLAIAHVRNLLKKEVDVIFFPKIATLKTMFEDTEHSHACPTVTGTPISVKAVLTKEEDVFEKKGILFVDPVLHFNDEELLEYELFNAFKKILGISRKENKLAVKEGFSCLEEYKKKIEKLGREVLEEVEREGRFAILVLARPYHNDPGVNHGITEELQKLGYPILTIESLPTDEDYISRIFKNRSPFKISDVWKKSYSENTNRKVWGALYASLHKNLAVLDMSSFRCGHDAPIYSVVEEILEKSGTPYFTFHEIDENKPSGSIKIRVETIDYFLKERTKLLTSCTQEDYKTLKTAEG